MFGWFKKKEVKSDFSKETPSKPKRIPMKRMTVQAITDAFPDFVHIPLGRPGYWFRRDAQPFLYSFLVIQASQKGVCCEVDVAVSWEEMWDKGYGIREGLSCGTGLANLREDSSSILMEDELYKFDPNVDSFQKCLQAIVDEIRQFALPFFSNREERLRSDPLTKFGMDWIQANIDDIPEDFEKHWFSNPGNPPKIEALEKLKSAIRLEATRIKADKEYRQGSTVLAIHLLRFASTCLK
ncbi:MAG: hypothetical protein HN909_02670 [Phycisphaerales bacterium]|jgi:hypothetical protein|nr:hypothetical protein [Phycisphaerales bacterium]MBT7170655.1 hypothetical protein [Phycisphaerales bacterium]